MNKKFVILFSLMFCLLCGCSNKDIPTTGIIDCYSVEITDENSTSFRGKYSTSYSSVYEYKNSYGETLYSNEYSTFKIDDEKKQKAPIYLYPNKYSEDYVEYSFVRFVGYLFVEYNYYLDLDNGYLDIATEWSEYLYEKNPNDVDESANNREAYKKASQGYYQIENDYWYSQENPHYSVKADLLDISLSRHSYKKLGDNSTVDFVPKWF